MKSLLWILFFCLGSSLAINAQEESKTPKNIKLVAERKDEKGNIVRTIEYMEGNIKVTKTFIIPPGGIKRKTNWAKFNIDTMNIDSMLVVIDKTNYTLSILYKKKKIKEYKTVFGPDRLKDKFQEGDRCTPEGWFKILAIRDNKNWGKFIQIDYPNAESVKKHNEAKSKGIIPLNAKIGHSIGIHGTYPTGAEMVELGLGWTDGCISMTTSDVMDFYKCVKPGMRVFIRK